MADVDVSSLEAQYGIPPGLYGAIINHGEMSGPTAVSPKGAVGRAQLMPQTAAAMGVDATDPQQNLIGGAKYTAQLWQKYQDPTLVAAAYNAGPWAVDSHGGVPPYPETQAYVQRVTGAMGDPTASMPSPSAVLGGYGSPQGGSPAASGAPAAAAPSGTPTPASATPDALPSPSDVLTNYGAPKPGGGSVVFADTGAAVPAAQEAAAQQLHAQGLFDPNAQPGQPGYVVALKPGETAPPGIASLAVDGTFTPAPATAQSTGSDVAKSLGSGLVQGVTGLNMLVPGSSDQLAAGQRIGDWIAGKLGAKVAPSDPNIDMLGRPTAAGMNAELGANYTPTTTAGRYAQTIGQFAPNALLPEGLIPRVAAVVVPALASQGAGDVAKAAGADQTGQDIAKFAGAVVGGGALEAAPNAGRAVVSAVAKPVENALAPFAARLSGPAAETQAGKVIAANASDLPAVRASLAAGPDQIVPGSTPTTFQQTGDTGLGSFERGLAVKNPGAFADARSGQNAARVQALGDVQSGADPLQVSQFLKGQFDNLDAEHAATVDAATQAAQAKASMLGGTGTPEAYGADLRNAVTDAETTARAKESAMWKAIDPNGDLTGNVQATKAAAADIVNAQRPTSTPMSGAESQIFDAAQQMPDIAPAADLIALRQNVNGALSAEARTAGRTPTYARLSQLKSAIDRNLATTISDKVVSDQAAVAAGRMAPADAMDARLNAEFGSFGNQAGGEVGAQAAAGASGVASPRVSGLDRTAGSSPGGPGNAAGNQGLSSADASINGALADITSLRASQSGSLFGAIQKLGGIKVRDATGAQIAGPDVVAALTDTQVPGLVNNQSGLPPEQMAQALAERGYFPSNADPSSAFEAALSKEARGSKVYQPGSIEADTALRNQAVNEEAQRAGVKLSDRPYAAAQKLAAYRNAVTNLRAKAQALGISNADEMSPEELWGDVQERQAIQGESPQPQDDPLGAEFDRLSSSSLTPTFDDAAAARLAAANAATRERGSTFGVQPIKPITASAGGPGQFKLPDGSVPSKVFHPGPSGFDNLTAYLKATGPSAVPVVQDYAAASLKRAAGNPDGTINPTRFATWQAQHADALRALPPETAAKFADASSASQAVGDAAVARTDALKAYQQGAVGRIMGLTEPQDVVRSVGTVLGSKTAVSDMKALATAAKANPDAAAGLRQAVADHIVGKFLGNTEAGTSGLTQIKGDQFQTFVRQNRQALSQVFSHKELDTFEAIAADIQRSNRSVTALKIPGGSNTAQDNLAAAKTSPSKGGRSLLDVVGGGIGAFAGHHFGPVGSMVGGAAGSALTDAVQSLRSAGINRVNDLVTKAMIDPAVAKALLDRIPVGTGKPVAALIKPKMTALLAALSGAQSADQSPHAPRNGLLQPGDHLSIRPAQNALMAAHP